MKVNEVLGLWGPSDSEKMEMAIQSVLRSRPKTGREAREVLHRMARIMGVKNLRTLEKRFHDQIRAGAVPKELSYHSNIGLDRSHPAFQVVHENQEDQLTADIQDLLVAAKASGLDEIGTEELVDQLVGLGHSATPGSLVTQFADERPDVMQNITVDKVTLDTADPTATPDEDTEENFERDVNKQAMDNIKRRAKQKKDIQL